MTKRKLLLGLLLAGMTGSVSAQNLKDAQAALQLEQYDKAKTILQQLIQKRPKDAVNYFYLGQIHLVNEKIDSAQYVFQQGAASNAKDKLNAVGLAAVELQKGNASAAESQLTQATSNLGRKDYLPLYYAGRAYINAPTPDYTKAIEYLTQARAKNTKDPLVPIALGDAYAGLRESNQAYIAYRDALSIDENLLAPRIGQAIISRWAQAYDVVIEDLNNLIGQHPTYAPLYRELAETYYYSSLKAPEEQYREINQKGVEAYKKYLELTGDASVEAKVRYADFLVYSGNYDELKVVSQELANAPGVDAKVYRYLGYIAFLQDKDYEKSREHMAKLFSEVEESRLIPRDFLIAGLAEIATNNQEKGVGLLKQAVAKQGEDEDLDAEIANTAFAKYQDGETELAAKIFAVPASNPESDYYFDSNYYLGIGEYGIGSRLISPVEGEEVTDGGAAKLAQARPHLESAVKSLGITASSEKKEIVERYKINALYYKGLSELALDNLVHNPEESRGIFIDSFKQMIAAIDAAGKTDDASIEYKAEANRYMGYYYYIKGDHTAAKSYFAEVIKLNPADEFAQQFLDAL